MSVKLNSNLYLGPVDIFPKFWHFNATYKIPINSPNSEQMKCIFPIKYADDFVVHCFVALHIDGLVQDYSNSSVLAMELLQSGT